jgi:hypothetical protein
MARPRLFEVMQKLADFPNRIALTKCGRVTSIKKLVDAGASREDAERIASEKQGETVAELEAERDAMIKEKTALQRFLRTKDPVDIPPGFSL